MGWSSSRFPALAVGGLLLAGFVARASGARAFVDDPVWRRPPFSLPLTRPPLFDAVRNVLGAGEALISPLAWLAAAAGVLAWWGPSTGDRGRIGLALLLVLAPPSWVLGVRPGTQALLAALVVVLAAAVEGMLRGRVPGRAVAGAAVALLALDWFAFCPVVALLISVLAFPPPWVPAPVRWRLAWALALPLAAAVVGYGLLIQAGADPRTGTGWSQLPQGPMALLALVSAVGSVLLGRLPALWPSIMAAAVLGALVWRALARGARGDRRAWVLGTVVAGTWMVAVALHQWFPAAVDKFLWFLTPLALALVAAELEALRPAAAIPLVLLAGGCVVDADADGHPVEGDCDDEDAAVHPGAPDLWDGVDNDCDGVVDQSPLYVNWQEVEPNDATLGGCFAPEGQSLGDLPGTGLLATVRGRVAHVADRSYDDSDRECLAVRIPDGVDHPRLELTLWWEGEENDLDLAVWGLWEGERAGFAQGDAPGPAPERAWTSSGFDAGQPLWIWVAPYRGKPVDWTLELVLR